MEKTVQTFNHSVCHNVIITSIHCTDFESFIFFLSPKMLDPFDKYKTRFNNAIGNRYEKEGRINKQTNKQINNQR